MHDLVIRNGMIADGSGRPCFPGSIGVDGDRIVAVGDVGERGRRELDADGLLVTPGFVDVHTHYDGQATWDEELAPSSWHGVTTAVFGNCGVGFAPVRPNTEDFLIELMEGVEDIPGSVLAEGITFSWESFPEYLDALAARRYAMDIGAQVPHSALRVYVMGERGADHLEAPTAEEIATMGRLAAEGVMAGALGFTTSRTRNHKTLAGRLIPTLSATREELLGIAAALSGRDLGVLQVVSDAFIEPTDDELDTEFDLLRTMALTSGRPISLSLLQGNGDGGHWRRVLDLISDARRDGAVMRAQVAPRAVGVLCGLQATSNPFGSKPSYRQIADLPLEERVREMRRPERRAAILSEPLGAHKFTRLVHDSMDRLFELGEEPDYEPDPSSSVAARAQRLGVSAHELAYELLLQREGRELLYFPVQNYQDGNLDAVRAMLEHPQAVPGLSDGGAHAGTLCDASFPTFLLAHWGRDRRRGERLPLESLVKAHTSDTAELVGLGDRGILASGYKADLNLIDFSELAVRAPVIVNDLPAGGRRLVQEAVGYRHTICSGVETFADGAPTGARPGALVRGAQPRP